MQCHKEKSSVVTTSYDSHKGSPTSFLANSNDIYSESVFEVGCQVNFEASFSDGFEVGNYRLLLGMRLSHFNASKLGLKRNG